MNGERVVDFLHRHRRALLAAYLLHAFLLHWFVLGFMSWDGLTYRVPPIIELVQHGGLGTDKYDQWAYAGYIPFVELAHAPFLWLFGLPGLLIGFPLVVLPLCVWAVYALVRELNGDARAATIGALTYLAVPFVNQQPYSGYIDFAACGLLAFFVLALLRLRARPTIGAAARLALATFLFTMSRTQGVYVVVVLAPALAYALFFERAGWRVRLTGARGLLLAIAAIVIGAAPSIAIQVWKYLHYGTPTYPMQFQLLGHTIGHGMSRKAYLSFAGIPDDSAIELFRAFVRGWFYLPHPPVALFSDSRELGGGLLLPLALVLLPAYVRRATRVEGWLLVAGAAVSWLAMDYVHPRYAYTIVLAIVVIVARTLPALATGGRGRWLFWPALVLVLAHLARPELDLRLRSGPRLNVTRSHWFQRARRPPEERWVLRLYPDLGARFVIVDHTLAGFVLQLYGKRLTNRVVGTIPAAKLGPACEGLAPYLVREPDIMIIDDGQHTRGCRRTCAIGREDACRAYRVEPGTAAAPAAPSPGSERL